MPTCPTQKAQKVRYSPSMVNICLPHLWQRTSSMHKHIGCNGWTHSLTNSRMRLSGDTCSSAWMTPVHSRV